MLIPMSTGLVQASESGAWDVSTAVFLQSSPTLSDSPNCDGLFFKADGSKMYVTDGGFDNVVEYNLSTAWDVSTSSYNSEKSISSQTSTPVSTFFKPDGTRMFVQGSDTVYQYSLSTAWDVSTASYDSKSFSVSSQESSTHGVFFKDDGTKMYILGFSTDTVYQYSLSTAWDVSTASYDSKSFSVSSQEGSPRELFIRSDGLKFYITGNSSDTVYQYSLSTAWDVSTASYDSKSFSVSPQEGVPKGLFLKEDGLNMYVCGSVSDKVHEYNLGP